MSCGTPDTPRFSYISPTRLLLSLVRLSSRVRLCIGIRYGVHYPFAYHYARFGLFPFRSPLLRKSIVFFLFLRVLRCFSSPGSLPQTMDSFTDNGRLKPLSSLIRKSADQKSFALPRSLSQLVTSFIGA